MSEEPAPASPIAAALPAWRVERHERLPSTQATVRERLEAGREVDGLVVRAGEQTAGRGRREKGWDSPIGGSYQSLVVQDRWGGSLRDPAITLHLAVSLGESFREAGAKVSVKWPNDLYLGEGKLGGLLCEYVRGHLVVGVGINVANPAPPTGAALTGWELAFVDDLVLAAVRAGLEIALEGAPGLAGRLEPLDHLRGRSVLVETATGLREGAYVGVDDEGALRLLADSGTVLVKSGTVRQWSGRPEG